MYEFQQHQAEFAAYIRNPEKNTVSDTRIEARRLKIYSDLFFNNIEGFLANGFPVLKSLMSQQQWLTMARSFVEFHESHSPYFLQISEEFLHFLEQDDCMVYTQLPQLAPFMQALAHYEWLELALDVAQEEFVASAGKLPSNILSSCAHVSPLAWSAMYQWPVHEISPQNIPTQPSSDAYCFVVYRNREQQVKFLSSNAATLRLLALLEEYAGKPVSHSIAHLADEMQQSEQSLTPFVSDLLAQLYALDIISHFD